MEIWRKIQITNGVVALVALALSVAAFYLPNCICWAKWAWTLALWLFMFLVPMPVIERNKRSNQGMLALSFFVAVCVAVTANIWLQELYPATHGFSRSMLVYSAAYTVVALLFAAWLKVKEQKQNK